MDVRITLTGRTPLVMHSVQLADPQNEYTRAIRKLTDKKSNKTDADIDEIAKLEWRGGLYIGQAEYKGEIVVPTWNVIRTLEEAARVTRKGRDVVRSVAAIETEVPLQFPDKGRTLEELWDMGEQYRFYMLVGVKRNKTPRMRPQFPNWALSMQVLLQENLLNFERLQEIATQAGVIEGLGDARKLGKGRFVATVEQLG